MKYTILMGCILAGAVLFGSIARVHHKTVVVDQNSVMDVKPYDSIDMPGDIGKPVALEATLWKISQARELKKARGNNTWPIKPANHSH